MAKKRGNPNMKKGQPSINPRGRKGKGPIETRMDSMPHLQRSDGWINAVTGVGSTTYDKRLGAEFCADIVSYGQAVELMRGDDVAQRSVMIPIEDSLRHGFDFNAQSEDEAFDAKELQEGVEDEWKTLGVKGKIEEALKYEGAFGGGAILLGVRDGVKDLSTPLNIDTVQSLDFLNVFEPRECIPSFYYADPRREKYGNPSHFQLAPYSPGSDANGETHTEEIHVHETRLLIFPGFKVTRDLLAQTNGWGDSRLSLLWRVLRDFNMSWAGTGVLIQDFAQAVVKFRGLSEMLAEEGGTTDLKTRLSGMELGRSILKLLVLDEEDSYERQTTNVTGLAELLKAYMGRVSSAAGGIPITKLFGVAPAGLNSSGESDIDQWDDRVKSFQDSKVIPHYERISELILKGKKADVKSSIVARPLRQQTDAERAATRKIVAETDALMIDRQVLGANEVRANRYEGDVWTMETVVESDVMAPSLADAEAEKQAAAEMQAEALKQANAQGDPNAEPAPGDTGEEDLEDE